ncbi:MAG TPA: hypothetical protein PLH71_09905, partial [Clostridia bacterium]|nr:hypothetical protein [Clostridia bacterium]
SLKYFCEETPEFYIAAAGSLLCAAINRQHYSFPVGKVESITLYPFDFEEYLWQEVRIYLMMKLDIPSII